MIKLMTLLLPMSPEHSCWWIQKTYYSSAIETPWNFKLSRSHLYSFTIYNTLTPNRPCPITHEIIDGAIIETITFLDIVEIDVCGSGELQCSKFHLHCTFRACFLTFNTKNYTENVHTFLLSRLRTSWELSDWWCTRKCFKISIFGGSKRLVKIFKHVDFGYRLTGVVCFSLSVSYVA